MLAIKMSHSQRRLPLSLWPNIFLTPATIFFLKYNVSFQCTAHTIISLISRWKGAGTQQKKVLVWLKRMGSKFMKLRNQFKLTWGQLEFTWTFNNNMTYKMICSFGCIMKNTSGAFNLNSWFVWPRCIQKSWCLRSSSWFAASPHKHHNNHHHSC